MMIQSIRRDSYGARRLSPLRHAPASSSVQSPRRGFTLIEVVVAMSILVVVVLALLSSYAFYYRSITNLRIQSIGANLAQLQLEDACNMGIASFKAVLGGKWNSSSSSPVLPWPSRFPLLYDWPNCPPAELFNASGSVVWYSYLRADRSAPIQGPSNLPASWYNLDGTAISPSGPQTGVLPSADVLASITYNLSDVPIEYNSGILDADFVVEKLSSVPSGVVVLPDSITLTPSSAPYTLDISKWTYPYYKKRITITDMSPNQSELSKKLYRVAVTVYWNGNGSSKSVTVEQEVSFEGQT